MTTDKEEIKEAIEQRAQELKKDFEGLTEEQKTMVAYRKIIKLLKEEYASISLSNGNIAETERTKTINEILAIIKASDYECGIIKPIMLYAMSDNYEMYKKFYLESLISLNKVLENYKLLAQELKINNALELSHLFSYMLWNGYYSVTKEHNYNIENRLLLLGMYSFDVIKGEGVCLAYAELLHNYLSVCEKKSSILLCKMGKDKEYKRDYIPQIERKIKKLSIPKKMLFSARNFVMQGIINKFGNHAVTLIEDDSKLYIYDSTNLLVLNILDSNTATLITGTGEFGLRPLTTIPLLSHADPNQLFEKLLSNNIKPAYTRDDIVSSFDNIINLLNNNRGLLDDAYDNIHQELEIINNQIEEIGGYRKLRKRIRQERANNIEGANNE